MSGVGGCAFAVPGALFGAAIKSIAAASNPATSVAEELKSGVMKGAKKGFIIGAWTTCVVDSMGSHGVKDRLKTLGLSSEGPVAQALTKMLVEHYHGWTIEEKMDRYKRSDRQESFP